MLQKLKDSLLRYQIVFPLLLSLIVLLRSYRLPGLSADSITYFQICRNILYAGKLGWEALWAPPLHSIIIAAVSHVSGIHDLLTVASLTSPLCAFLLVPTVYWLALQVFDRRCALLAATFTAIFPHLLSIAYSAEPEIIYTLLLTLALAVFAAALRRSSLLLAAAAGSIFSLAYLSRSEGFMVMVLLFLVLTAMQGRKLLLSSTFRLCVVATVMFFIVSLPYLLFLKQHYGAFVISPKASYVMIWMKGKIYNDHDINEVADPALWGLNSEGKLRWQEPKGIGDLFAYLMSHPGKSLSVYLNNLSHEVPGRIPNNSGMEHFPQLFPVYLALAALFAVFQPWGPLGREKKALLLAPLLIFLVLPVFTSGWWKYLVPYLPLVLIMAARGIVSLAGLVATGRNSARQEKMTAILVAATVIIVGSRFFLAFHPYIFSKAPEPSEISRSRVYSGEVCKDLGLLAFQEFGPGKNYMAPWNKYIYYFDGLWTALPVAMYYELHKYALDHKVDYFVKEATDVNELYYSGFPSGFELVKIIKSDKYDYVLGFYRVLGNNQP